MQGVLFEIWYDCLSKAISRKGTPKGLPSKWDEALSKKRGPTMLKPSSRFRMKYLRLPAWLWPFLVALALRLIALDIRPLWYDEAFGVVLARQGWGGIATATWRALLQGHRGEHHTPLFYFLLWGWTELFGDGVVQVRLLSVVWGMVAWALAWKLAHRWLSPSTARMAAWMVALSPFQIHYAQEARMYSMLAAAALGLLWSFEQARTTGRRIWWVVTTGFGILLLYTHNAAILYLAAWAPLAFYIAHKENRLGPLLAAGLGMGLAYLPWAWVLRVQVGHVKQAYWILPPGLTEILNTLLAFTVHVPMPGWTAISAFVLTMVLLAVGLWHTLRHSSSPRTLLIALLAPWAFIFLFSQWLPVYLVRLLTPLGILYLFWLAWALWEAAPRREIGRVLLVVWLLAAGLGMGVHLTYQGFPYAPFPQLAAWLEAHRQAGEWIVHSNKLSYLPMHYIAPHLEQMYLPDPPGSGSDTLSPMMQKGLGIPPPLNPQVLETYQSRMWFLVFEKEIQDYHRLGLPHPYLDGPLARFCTSGPERWGDLLVYAFQPCPQTRSNEPSADVKDVQASLGKWCQSGWPLPPSAGRPARKAAGPSDSP